MRKHAKIVILSLIATVIVLASTVLFLSRPEPSTIGQLIPYLANRQATDVSETLTSFSSPRTGTMSNKMHVTTFTIDEEFDVVRDLVQKELKPRTLTVTNYSLKDTKFTMMNIGKPGSKGGLSITIRRVWDGQTTVGVIEHRSLNPMDRIKLWYAGITSKKKGGIQVVSNGKPSP